MDLLSSSSTFVLTTSTLSFPPLALTTTVGPTSQKYLIDQIRGVTAYTTMSNLFSGM